MNVIGHCGGARLAVEVIRQLEERGCSVLNFIAIDTRPPVAKGRSDVATATQSAGSMAPAPYTANRIAKAVMRRTKRTLKTSWGTLTGQDELTREVRGELVERACYLADGAYRATQFPNRVTVLHSHDSPDRSFDWDPVVNDVDHQTLQVGHYTMFFEPDVEILKDAILQRLA